MVKETMIMIVLCSQSHSHALYSCHFILFSVIVFLLVGLME